MKHIKYIFALIFFGLALWGPDRIIWKVIFGIVVILITLFVYAINMFMEIEGTEPDLEQRIKEIEENKEL